MTVFSMRLTICVSTNEFVGGGGVVADDEVFDVRRENVVVRDDNVLDMGVFGFGDDIPVALETVLPTDFLEDEEEGRGDFDNEERDEEEEVVDCGTSRALDDMDVLVSGLTDVGDDDASFAEPDDELRRASLRENRRRPLVMDSLFLGTTAAASPPPPPLVLFAVSAALTTAASGKTTMWPAAVASTSSTAAVAGGSAAATSGDGKVEVLRLVPVSAAGGTDGISEVELVLVQLGGNSIAKTSSSTRSECWTGASVSESSSLRAPVDKAAASGSTSVCTTTSPPSPSARALPVLPSSPPASGAETAAAAPPRNNNPPIRDDGSSEKERVLRAALFATPPPPLLLLFGAAEGAKESRRRRSRHPDDSSLALCSMLSAQEIGSGSENRSPHR